MAVAKPIYGTRTALTTSAMNSLANNTYVSCGTITFISSSKVPAGCKLECAVTPGSVGGAQQVTIFARISQDGTDFTTGPVSGTSSTNERNLYLIGIIPCRSSSTLQRRTFDLAQVFDVLPPYVQIVARNLTGASLAASGNSVHYHEYDWDLT